MAHTLAPYLEVIRTTLNAALCLQNYPSQVVERQSRPEIEFKDTAAVILKPLTIARDENERCLIEPSVNSVRISIKDVYVLRLGCSCDSSALAVATSEHDLCILDPSTLKPIRRLQGHRDVVEDLGFFQADPSCLASCSHDGAAKVWDLRAAESARSFSVASHEVYSCCVGRSDALLACAASHKVHLFDVAQGKQVKVFKDCHTDVVNHVRFHPQTGQLFTGAEDNLVVVLDTEKSREDEAMVGVVPNGECVRSFTLVGPDRNTLCCCSTTEDVRIWDVGGESFGGLRAQFMGLRSHPLLMRGGDEDFGLGYVVETFYDQPSAEVFLLAGAGNCDLVLFRVTLAEAVPAAVFGGGHSGVVRSALCLPGGRVLTAGEDGRICAWSEAGSSGGGGQFALEPTAYAATRAAGLARAKMLCRKFASFFTQRAEHFVVLRRKPVEGYDISFLITNTHLEEMVKERIVDFIIEFMEDVDKEIKDLKIALNTRLRAAAAAYMSQFSQRG
ncbi:unnamed protein product [Effrenium voratum]|nr:unnamed protein product [Effrenium voratum]